MRRRELISLLGCATVAAPFAARAEQPATSMVGYLASWSPDSYGRRGLSAFRQGLAEAGFSEGKNVAIEVRWAEGRYDRLHAMAADLVRLRVGAIATSATSATIAATAETRTIPIVFSMAGDPVALGLVATLSRPGGNLTGATQLNVELAPKRLQLLRDLLPGVASMALLVNPANAAVVEPQQRAVEAAARTIGLTLHVLNARDEREIADAFAVAVERRVSGLVIAVDAFFTTQATKLGALTLRHRLPTIYSLREFVAAGGLIGYSGSAVETNRIAGLYVGRILKGEKPGDLPVQQSTQTELSINLATAKVLDIAVPPSLLARADEVIE